MIIYTIGTSNKTLTQLYEDISLINSVDSIDLFIDMRSRPNALPSWRESLRPSILRRLLPESYHIDYVPMNRTLGNPDNQYYDSSGRLISEAYLASETYCKQIRRISEYAEHRHILLVGTTLCPENDGRGLLVGRSLKELGYDVRHIVRPHKGVMRIYDQEQLEDNLIEEVFGASDYAQLSFLGELMSRRDMVTEAYRIKAASVCSRIDPLLMSTHGGDDFIADFR